VIKDQSLALDIADVKVLQSDNNKEGRVAMIDSPPPTLLNYFKYFY